MISKDEIAIWTTAVDLYSKNRANDAISMFSQINSYSKVLFNMGAIYNSFQDYENGDILFGKSIQADEYFAAAYFQKGMSLFMLFEYDLAANCYQFCVDLLQENDDIDYTSLGLPFKLYRCEVLFNLAACNLEMGDSLKADSLLVDAFACRRTPEHMSKISNMLPGHFELFSIPATLLFTVPSEKVKNVQKRDFLKSSKLVVDTEQESGKKVRFMGFSGASIVSSVDTDDSTLVRRKTDASSSLPRMHSPKQTDDAYFLKSVTSPRLNYDHLKASRRRNHSTEDSLDPFVQQEQRDFYLGERKQNNTFNAHMPARNASLPDSLTQEELNSSSSRNHRVRKHSNTFNAHMPARNASLPDSFIQEELNSSLSRNHREKHSNTFNAHMPARNASLPDSFIQEELNSSLSRNHRDSRERKHLPARKSSRSYSRFPQVQSTAVLSEERYDSGYENISVGLKDMNLPSSDIQPSSPSFRRDLKVTVHTKKSNTTFRTKRGIIFGDFLLDAQEALNLPGPPGNLFFADEDDTIISIIDQDSLNIALESHDKSVHLYLLTAGDLFLGLHR